MTKQKRKITVTTGTRADYGIQRQILKKIKESSKLELYLIVTGMHLSKKFGLTINEIKKDKFKIDKTINYIPKKDSAFQSTRVLGKAIILFSEYFHKIKPDINLVFGDRDEMLASAIAASHMNIPNAHIHGGDASGGIDEYNRHAITKLSNIHFAATQKSKNRIIQLGENPKFVFLTGSPSIDEIVENRITSKQILERKLDLKIGSDTIVLIYHPVTTQLSLIDMQIKNILKVILKMKKHTIIISPNSDPGHDTIFTNLKQIIPLNPFLKFYSSLPRADYLCLLKNCGLLVGNSSSGLIEASYLGTPVVNIGIRQHGREKHKNAINASPDSALEIEKAIKRALKQKKSRKTHSYLYGNGTASKKIVKHLERITLDKKLIQKQIYY